jgi:hypothetical protein
VCEEHLPTEWTVENSLHQHAPYRGLLREVARGALPPFVADLPVLAFVRNPWDWYVSWYHHELAQPDGHSPYWRRAFDFESGDFKHIVTKACTEPVGDHAVTRLMRRDGIDFLSAGYKLLVSEGVPPGRIEVGRFERLRDDFLGFLARHGVPVSERFERAVRESAPVNVSRRDHYHEYYDDELRELVARAAHDVIHEYGYEF